MSGFDPLYSQSYSKTGQLVPENKQVSRLTRLRNGGDRKNFAPFQAMLKRTLSPYSTAGSHFNNEKVWRQEKKFTLGRMIFLDANPPGIVILRRAKLNL